MDINVFRRTEIEVLVQFQSILGNLRPKLNSRHFTSKLSQYQM